MRHPHRTVNQWRLNAQLLSSGPAIAAAIGRSDVVTLLGDTDRMRVALTDWARINSMSHLPEGRDFSRVIFQQAWFHVDVVRHPAMMEARRIDCFTDWHVEFQHVQDHAEH